MQPDNYFYWDANLFLAYLNNEVPNALTLDTVLENIRKNNKEKIVTSVLSKVEVAWVSTEKLNRTLSVAEEARIDDLWNDSSVIELVEFNDEIAHISRDFLRKSMSNQLTLKFPDAIHIATAKWVGACEMNTYDANLYKFSTLFDIKIHAPNVLQPKIL
jgi:predicted nucleic acid-binding protein